METKVKSLLLNMSKNKQFQKTIRDILVFLYSKSENIFFYIKNILFFFNLK